VAGQASVSAAQASGALLCGLARPPGPKAACRPSAVIDKQ